MIDFALQTFMEALKDLNIAQIRAQMAIPEEFPTDEQLKLLHEDLAKIINEAERLSLPTVKKRLANIQMLFSRGGRTTNGALIYELHELFNAIEYDSIEEYFFHYPRDVARMSLSINDEWGDVILRYPSSKREIEAGIDCYATEDFPGCIFHMVRVSELGLRSIAIERGITTVRRGIPIEWAMWGEIFSALETKIEEIHNKPAGPNKDAAQIFYDQALSDLRFLRNYRDPTLHFRDSYGRGEAFDAIYRAKGLMKSLAPKLSENTSRTIDWGL